MDVLADSGISLSLWNPSFLNELLIKQEVKQKQVDIEEESNKKDEEHDDSFEQQKEEQIVQPEEIDKVPLQSTSSQTATPIIKRSPRQQKEEFDKSVSLATPPKRNASCPVSLVRQLTLQVIGKRGKRYVSRRKQRLVQTDVLFLTKINLDTHAQSLLYDNPNAQQLCEYYKTCKRQYYQAFKVKNKMHFIQACLSTARIYKNHADIYHEIKRIPQREIEVGPKLISCIHHSDSKFYLALCDENGHTTIEVRDISGVLIEESPCIKHIVESIHSDASYVYAITRKNVVYIHLRNLFCLHYIIEYPCPVISCSVISASHKSETLLHLLAITDKEIILSDYTYFKGHTVTNNFQFNSEEDLKIISTKSVDQTHIIVKNGPCFSRIDFGYVVPIATQSNSEFVVDISLKFDTYIQQVEQHGNYLFILAKRQRGTSYELGCIFMPSMQVKWIVYLEKAIDYDLFLVQNSTNFILFKDSENFETLDLERLPPKKFCQKCQMDVYVKNDGEFNHIKRSHLSTFSNLKREQNMMLRMISLSAFKKMP